MKCTDCKIDYPDGLVREQQSGTINLLGQAKVKNSINLCGICALQRSNELHGVERKQFDGPKAEAMRQAAIKFRKEHNSEPLT